MDRYSVGHLVEPPPSKSFIDGMVRRGIYFEANGAGAVVALPPVLGPMAPIRVDVADRGGRPNLAPMRWNNDEGGDVDD